MNVERDILAAGITDRALKFLDDANKDFSRIIQTQAIVILDRIQKVVMNCDIDSETAFDEIIEILAENNFPIAIRHRK